MRRSRLSLILPLLVAACVAAPKVAPPPPPARLPAPAPPPPVALDWRVAPVDAGTWTYLRDDVGSAARFGPSGGVAEFELRCDRATRTVALSRTGAAGPMTVTTSYGVRSFTAAALPDGRAAVALPAADPFLDQLAFSRARFAIEGAAGPRLILPAWAEPTRVVEDCRA